MAYSEIYNYISSDDAKSRQLFIKDFEKELIELSKLFSDAFDLLEKSPCKKDPSIRASTVSGYISLAIESAVTACQLLVLGHIAPAGNSMRISYESLCYSALLKKEVDLVVSNGKYRFNFYNDYVKRINHTRADKVIDVVVKNKEALGLNDDGVDFLVSAKKFYNGYSHASLMLLHSKINPSTLQLYIAGGYENKRLELFKQQLDFIKRYSTNFNGWIQVVAYNAT
jgi:hypothetical protein